MIFYILALLSVYSRKLSVHLLQYKNLPTQTWYFNIHVLRLVSLPLQIPEFASWFYVNLTTTASGTIIAGPTSSLFSYCNVSMTESDYPAGRIGFDSRYRFVVLYLLSSFNYQKLRKGPFTFKDRTVLMNSQGPYVPWNRS